MRVSLFRHFMSIRSNIAVATALALPTSAAYAADGPTSLGQDFLLPAVVGVVGLALGGVTAYFYLGYLRGTTRGDDDESKVIAATKEIGVVIGGFAALGAAALAVACLGLPADQGSFAAMFGIDMLVGGAAGALGGLLGFIFGVPRTVDIVRKAGDSEDTAASVALGANTNLERVSDWLTTLLIGATLVQIKDVPRWIGELSNYLGASPGLTNPKLIPFVCLYFFVLAFLGVYLITRLYLTAALKDALGFVSAAGGVSATALVGEQLKSVLTDGTADDLKAALDALDNWPLTETQRRDPQLNTRLAQVLSRYLTGGKVDDTAARREQMRNALTNAAADPTQKTVVLKALQSKKLTSGDAATDIDLVRLVS